MQIVQDASDGVSVESFLEAAAKALDTAELEYSRYGDTLFEVFFAGGRLGTGASLAEGGARLANYVGAPAVCYIASFSFAHGNVLTMTISFSQVLASGAERDAILPYIKVFQSLTRLVPWLLYRSTTSPTYTRKQNHTDVQDDTRHT